MKVNLPVRINFCDYHEIDAVRDAMRKIIPGAKAREIGYNEDSGSYVAILYYRKQDKDFRKLEKEIMAELKEATDYWGTARRPKKHA